MSAAPDPARGGASRVLDVAAVVLLIAGGVVIPLVGWIVGVVLLWVSRSWTTREKLLGTLAPPGGLMLPAALLLVGGGACSPEAADVQVAARSCDGFALPVWLGVPLVAGLAILPIVVGVVLLRRADVRREPPRPGSLTR